MLLLLAGLAGALIVFGLRGRRVHERPVCAKCRSEVTGLIAGSRVAGEAGVARCPECGVDLSRRGAVRQGMRRRRRLPLAIGVLLLLLMTSAGVIVLAKGLTQASVAARLPTWVLLTISRTDPHQAYLEELAERVHDGKTGPEENASLALHLVSRLSDPTQGMTKAWTTVFFALYRVNAITDADIEKALKNILAAELRTRDTVRAKGVLTVMVDITPPRWESPVSLTFGAGGGTAEFRDAQGQIIARVSQPGYTLRHGQRLYAATMSSGLHVPDIAPGTYDVEFTVPIVAGVEVDIGDKLPIEIPVRVRKQIVVIAQDQTLINVLHDPAQVARVRASIDSIKVRVDGSPDAAYLYATVTFKDLPVDVAWRVYATPAGASDEARIPLGSLVAQVIMRPDGTYAYGIGGKIPSGFESPLIDLIFEPDVAAAERNIDVHEITGATVRVEGVAVDWTNFQRPAP